MANKRQKANIAAAIRQSADVPAVTTQGSMTQPNSKGVSIFVPNRGAVATPPPLDQPKKKIKLSVMTLDAIVCRVCAQMCE